MKIYQTKKNLSIFKNQTFFKIFLMLFAISNGCTFFKKSTREPVFTPPAPEIEAGNSSLNPTPTALAIPTISPAPLTQSNANNAGTSPPSTIPVTNTADTPHPNETAKAPPSDSNSFPEGISGVWRLEYNACMQAALSTSNLSDWNLKLNSGSRSEVITLGKTDSYLKSGFCGTGSAKTVCCEFNFKVEPTFPIQGNLSLKFLGETPIINRNGLPIEACTAGPMTGSYNFRFEKSEGKLVLYGKILLSASNNLCTSGETLSVYKFIAPN